MAQKPSDILTRTKTPEKKDDSKDDKKEEPKKGVKRNALVDFIAKHKRGEKAAGKA